MSVKEETRTRWQEPVFTEVCHIRMGQGRYGFCGALMTHSMIGIDIRRGVDRMPTKCPKCGQPKCPECRAAYIAAGGIL